LTTGGIDDLCLKQFVEAGAMAVRRCRKIDLKRIAKASGGLLLSEYIPYTIAFSDSRIFVGDIGR
jgi:chaperonin GroEL (HSP60 family)